MFTSRKPNHCFHGKSQFTRNRLISRRGVDIQEYLQQRRATFQRIYRVNVCGKEVPESRQRRQREIATREETQALRTISHPDVESVKAKMYFRHRRPNLFGLRRRKCKAILLSGRTDGFLSSEATICASTIDKYIGGEE